ncbi:histidine kinase [Hymenobacter setariae]|uniref:histidine kinase n=2 Tax=Hymenobacter setariae TaxID=2594794 RepID=A0A558BLP9_9BACT|nr:histidine kinase [Hymenobacter setariae]
MLYAWLGFPLAPIATFIYVGFSALNLLVLFITKRYTFFTTTQLVFIILNPIMAHVAIGGFIDSSGIILSAILSPLGALLFTNYRTARIYFFLFVADVVLAGVWDWQHLDQQPRLPKEVRTISFVSNMLIICLVVYLLIEDTLKKKEQAQQQLQKSLDHLQATQAQLVQREKMASLGELTAGIAHEIQNPLNFVNNFAEVSAELLDELEEEQQKPQRDASLEAELLADVQQNLHKISQHGQRAGSIVRAMLEHSRSSTGERQPTDLNALADEYLRLAYHGLRAKDKLFNATLALDLAPDLPLVLGAGADLGRVLLNLFNNAFYAVHQRQQAGEPDYAPTVGVATRAVGNRVEVRVHDNGAGIPANIQAKIFQPFFTTKPTGEGTGLGLSLTHDIIVNGHGGTLTVESQVGVGTTFAITLPGT